MFPFLMKLFWKIQPPTQETASLLTTPLIERVPSEAGAVILVRIDHLLDKGGEDIAALFSTGVTHGSQNSRRSIFFGP